MEGVELVTVIFVMPEKVSIPLVYSDPPLWIPSLVVENLKGWDDEWLKLYVFPASRVIDLLCSFAMV